MAKVKKILILSRHNIRAPLIDVDSSIKEGCIHEWYKWPCNTGELTPRGTEREKIFGSYFKEYLDSIDFNVKEKEIYVYSNSFHRTYYTAKNFIEKCFPNYKITINHKNKLGNNDEVFATNIHDATDEFRDQVEKEVNEMFGGDYQVLKSELYENMLLVEEVIGFKKSKLAKKEGLEHISNKDISLVMENGKIASSNGFVQDVTTYADALIMQYLEESDDIKAGFGKKMSFEKWKMIGDVVSTTLMLACRSYTETKKTSKPILKLVLEELNNENHKFTFLSGHDYTIVSMLSALKVKDYRLPNSVTDICPIGGKILFKIYDDDTIDISYIYEGTHQVRNDEKLKLDNPPQEYSLEFDCDMNLKDFSNKILLELDN